MTKIRRTSDSSMVRDRRGAGGGMGGMGGLGGVIGGLGRGGLAGGGLLGMLVLLAAIFLPQLLGGGGTQSATDTGRAGEECDDEVESIVCGAVEDVQAFWTDELAGSGGGYQATETVFFTGAVDTGCGRATAQVGPFYCPADRLVYFDLDFLQQLMDQFDFGGDLAIQYIVAHEYGHHLQNLLGVSDRVRQAQAQDPGRANEYSVQLELQADCLAGVWAHSVQERGLFSDENEAREALDAAAAVGDDRIQERTTGQIDQESWTHGSAEQRQTWFNRGFRSGDMNQCDTFAG